MNKDGFILTDYNGEGLLCGYTGEIKNNELKIPDNVEIIDDDFSSPFYFEMRKVKRLYIPESVKEIRGASLRGFTELEEIIIDKNNKTFKIIDNCIVEKNAKRLIKGALNSKIPDNIRTICQGAFIGNYKLKSLIIPESVEEINKHAFQYCENLESIIFPENIKLIERCAFAGCKNLKHIKLNKVKEIEYGVFSRCLSLERVFIPRTVNKMLYYVFSGCVNIKIFCENEKKCEKWEDDWNNILYISPDKSIKAPTIWGVTEDQMNFI